MHVIKPQAMGICFRPMEYRKRFGLCVSGYLHVPFAQAAGGTLWGEQSMWNFLSTEMAVPLIDEGVAKLSSEFLVHGHAYSQPGHPNAVAVRARLGDTQKILLAFGDRHWDRDRPSEPLPFECIALDWRQAYGGPDYPDNPVGKGRVPVDGRRPLPNLELPDDRLVEPRQSVAPAGFGPLEVVHPQRASLRGTYDEAWLKDHSPGFAPDLSWKHFNLAPRDQWLDAVLQGNEPYELEHLHPTRPMIAGTLPGLRVRVFARRRPAGAPGSAGKLREVSMRLTTVWFFPAAERMVLVFHGLAETTEDDGSDIDLLLGAIDRLGDDSKRDDAHFLEVLAKRSHPDTAQYEVLNDEDLLPPGLDTFDPSREAAEALMRPVGLREDAAHRRAQVDVSMAREKILASGGDPDAMGVKLLPKQKPPTPSELPAYMRRAQEEEAARKWATLEKAVGDLERLQALIANKKVDPARLVPRGPPALQAAAPMIATMERAQARAGVPFDREAALAKFDQLEIARKRSYLQGAHLQAPAFALQGALAMERRAEVEWLLSQGLRDWAYFDFTGADLSNLDLRGVNFSGAWLESANLSGSNLSRARFTAAVLAHANFAGVIAVGADFVGANLGGADFERALLDGSDLTGATLMRAQLHATEMRGVILDQVNVLETSWKKSELSPASADGVVFLQLDLKGNLLSGAELRGCAFVECDLSGVDLQRANLAGASFTTCNAEGARFSGADLTGAIFVSGTRLMKTDFTGATLRNANLGACDASGSGFARAVLDGANLADATLADCDLRGARAVGALMRKADLRRTRFENADLRDAILQKADVRGANLTGAQFFGADLSRMRLDGDVKLDGAVLERARTYPRLTPAQQEGRA